MLNIKFLGAANTVTGSCYLITSDKYKIVVDCGMFQGQDVEALNYEKFEFDPAEVDFVVLTHSHLDHCGLLPKLYKQGFRGKLYVTTITSEISKVILFDAAKLQEYKEKDERIPAGPLLYDTKDVEGLVALYQLCELNKDISLMEDLWIRFLPVGHILGAASVLINIDGKQILFSGDIGRLKQPLIKSFDEFDYSTIKPDYIIMESLYGGLTHENRDDCIDTLLQSVRETIKEGGKVIIPVFALHRAQEMLELFKVAFLYDLVPDDISLFLDSPMATEVTEVYKQNSTSFNSFFDYKDIHIHYYNNESDRNGMVDEIDNASRFDFNQMNNVKRSKKSMRVSNFNRCVIMAGSGMADGGRVVKHLANNLDDPKNTVIFVGFQAEGTLGRQLVEGAEQVQINGKTINVRAKILYLRAFSAHGDNNDLENWVGKFGAENLRNLFLIHGEPERILNFSEILNQKGYKTRIPSRFDTFDL